MTLDCQLLVPRVLALGWNPASPKESNYVGAVKLSEVDSLETSGHDYAMTALHCLAVEDLLFSGHCVEFFFYSSCIWYHVICFQGIKLVETPETPQNMPWPLRHRL